MLMLILSLYQMQEQTGKPINDEPITDSIQVDIDSLKKVNNSGRFITHVTLTTYNPVEAQCDSDPLVTADGTKIDLNKLKKGKIKYCAVSRDLLWCLPYGSVLEIEGHGMYIVKDTMNERFNHCIDILQHVSEKNFKKTKVKVVKIK
jgi:3D (Asp-Asp-Asp) domain-containing protein